MAAILDIEMELSNSKSPCRPETSHKVLAQFDFPLGRCRLKNFKMGAILDIKTEQIKQILNLHVAPIPPTKFQLNLTFRSGRYGGHL